MTMSSDADEVDLESLVGQIAGEFTERCGRGELPDIEEYTRRYPNLADVLRGVLPAVLMLAGSSASRTDHSADLSPDASTPTLPPRDRPPAMPARLGDFELLAELGRGGMGVVYKARQTSLDRLVALKMLRGGASPDDEALQRFRDEARTIAQLQHPNIVQVFEVSEADGQPYFAMEYVPGGSLAAALQGTPLPPTVGARLVETLAHAVQHAHQYGIIHRDLKPANVLLQGSVTIDRFARNDVSSLIPKITDFGLVKRLNQDSGQTQTGAVLGTPSYMAPEQAFGRNREIEPAADIYALGAILYELLTGRPPFKGTTALETLDQVRSQEPLPPSRLQPGLPRDLETICLKCLRKEPGKRYATAAALADDLHAFQAGRPIQARPAGAVERTVKWARRRPAAALALGMSCIAILAVIGFAFHFAYSQQLESSNRAVAGALRRTEEALTAESEAKRIAEEARGDARAALERERRVLYLNRILLAQSEWRDNQPIRARKLHADCPADLHQWEWHYLNRLFFVELHTLRGHSDFVYAVAYSPDGTRAASAGTDSTVRLWDPATGKAVRTLYGHAGELFSVAFSPDGRYLASAGVDRRIKVWDVAAGTEVRTLQGHTDTIMKVTWSLDGKRLASADRDSLIKVWDMTTGKDLWTFKGNGAATCGVAFGPQNRLASCGEDNLVRIWDLTTGKETRQLAGHLGVVNRVGFIPGSRHLASCGADGTVRFWDTSTGREAYIVRLPDSLEDLAVSSDGKRLAVAGLQRAIYIVDTGSREEEFTLRGHTDMIWGVAFNREGTRLASGSRDSTVKIWDITRSPEGQRISDARGTVYSLAFSPDGRHLAFGGIGNIILLWDTVAGKVVHTLHGHTGQINSLTFHRDGKHLASASSDKSIKLWDVQAGRDILTLQDHKSSVRDLAFSPDGQRLAGACHDRSVKVWDMATTKQVLSVAQPESVHGVTFSPDGRHLASACGDGTIRIWDAHNGELINSLQGHSSACVAYSPDGTRLASAGGDGTIHIWDMARAVVILTLHGHTEAVTRVAFSPDGQRLASGGKDRVVKVWDVLTGQQALTLRIHHGTINHVVFSPSGHQLASAASGVRIWDATPRKSPIESKP